MDQIKRVILRLFNIYFKWAYFQLILLLKQIEFSGSSLLNNRKLFDGQKGESLKLINVPDQIRAKVISVTLLLFDSIEY